MEFAEKVRRTNLCRARGDDSSSSARLNSQEMFRCED